MYTVSLRSHTGQSYTVSSSPTDFTILPPILL